jgi:hypothetical protein
VENIVSWVFNTFVVRDVGVASHPTNVFPAVLVLIALHVIAKGKEKVGDYDLWDLVSQKSLTTYFNTHFSKDKINLSNASLQRLPAYFGSNLYLFPFKFY